MGTSQKFTDGFCQITNWPKVRHEQLSWQVQPKNPQSLIYLRGKFNSRDWHGSGVLLFLAQHTIQQSSRSCYCNDCRLSADLLYFAFVSALCGGVVAWD